MVLGALLMTSCDFFRKLADRPTSGQIEAKRYEIALKERHEEEIRLAKADSALKAEREVADSLAAVDSLAGMRGIFLPPSRVGGIGDIALDCRYYIIVGSFSHRDNAERFASIFTDKGYSGTIIPFRNGFNAVGLDKTNRIAEAYASLMKILQEPECPQGVWILVNEKK